MLGNNIFGFFFVYEQLRLCFTCWKLGFESCLDLSHYIVKHWVIVPCQTIDNRFECQGSFGWVRKYQGPLLSQKLGYTKEPSPFNGRKPQRLVQIWSPLQVMVMSPYEWKILKMNNNKQKWKTWFTLVWESLRNTTQVFFNPYQTISFSY